MFKWLGDKVIGYDLYINEIAKSILEYKSLDEVIKQSYIISVHIRLSKVKMKNDKCNNLFLK